MAGDGLESGGWESQLRAPLCPDRRHSSVSCTSLAEREVAGSLGRKQRQHSSAAVLATSLGQQESGVTIVVSQEDQAGIRQRRKSED